MGLVMSDGKNTSKYKGCNKPIEVGQYAYWWYWDGPKVDMCRIPDITCETNGRLCIPCAEKYGLVW